MNNKVTFYAVLPLVLAAAVVFALGHRASAQQSASATPAATATAQSATAAHTENGMNSMGMAGMAPGLKVTDLGSAGRTFRVNMVKGDEIISGLTEFAARNHIKNGHFTGLGAVDKATLRWSDPVNRGSKTNEINEEAEVASLVGSITMDKDGKPVVHAHTVLGLSDGTARAGHLMNGHVSIIAEIFVTEEQSPATGQ
jgi:predicted DNA-binding protein with PD1-like motif